MTRDIERAYLAEVERLRDENRKLHKSLDRLTDPEMKHLRLENGKIDMAVAGPMVEQLVVAVGGMFHEEGAKNYFEYSLHSKEGDHYAVTIQKVSGGQTPHVLRMKAEEKAEKLREALQKLYDAGVEECEEFGCNFDETDPDDPLALAARVLAEAGAL